METRWLWRMTVVAVVAVVGCAGLPTTRKAGVERAQIQSQVEEVRAELQGVRRDLSELRAEIGRSRYSGRDRSTIASRLEKLEQRVGLVEGASAPMSVQPSRDESRKKPAPARTVPAEWSEIIADELNREDKRSVPGEYRHALRLVRDKAYEHAIQAFYNFLNANPGSELAADCHYWIAASYYLLGEHYRAILSFNEVRQQYAGSSRAPGAALMIGFAFLQMGNSEEARLAFQKTVSDYPASREAAQARERLEDLSR